MKEGGGFEEGRALEVGNQARKETCSALDGHLKGGRFAELDVLSEMAPPKDVGPAEVCEELDQVILHIFDALELLQTKRKAFNSLVEQGWFSLSKSRYAMGNKSVSTLQYGHQMTPLVTVKTSETEEGRVQFNIVAEDLDAHKQKVESTAVVEEIGSSEQGAGIYRSLELE